MYTKAEEKLVQGDRAWFEEHPKRNYRVRLTDTLEILGLKHPEDPNPPPSPPEGMIPYIAVRNIRPGYRSRRLVFFYDGYDLSRCDDEISREFYEQFITLDTIKELDKFRIK